LKQPASLSKKVVGKVTLKFKYSDFQTVTRTYSSTTNMDQLNQIIRILPELLSRTEAGKKAVLLVGITASNLLPNDIETHDE